MIDWPGFLDFTTRQAFWTILVGILCNSCCALLGCFLVLRRMSMLGDALSHAVLPGLVIAFLLTSSTAPLPMFLGATVFAMLTAGISRLLTSLGHTTEESGLGISFTAFFALGILLIQMFAQNVHLDRDAVLEGAIEFVTLDTLEFAGRDWPVSFWVTGLVLLGVIAWLLLFWKEIKAATFDPVYATAIGLHGQAMLSLLTVLVAICVVASFKIVGSILVVAMLVVPAASAQLLCQRMSSMLWCAVGFSCLATVLGYLLAQQWNTSAAGMMAVMTGIGYAAALCFSPTQGLLAVYWRRRQLQRQIEQEDVLGALYRWQEQQPAGEAAAITWQTLRGLKGITVSKSILQQLVQAGLLAKGEAEQFQLTAAGKSRAEQLVRGHRLWESFLESQFELPGDHLHAAAHQMEHYLDHESHRQIDQQLGSPESDPHGRAIPPDAG